MQFGFHGEQFFAFAFQHLVNGNAGPARDDLGDVGGGDRFFHQVTGVLGFGKAELLFEFGNLAVGEFACFCEVAFALGDFEIASCGFELFLELRG